MAAIKEQGALGTFISCTARRGDIEPRRSMGRALGGGNGSEWPEEEKWTPFSEWGKGERESTGVKLQKIPRLLQARSAAKSEGGVQKTGEGWD